MSTPEDIEPTEPIEEGAGRLRRSRDNRVIAGVCGGLATHLGVDPVIVRIAAVALVFAGGAGLLAYLALLLLVPSEPSGGGQPAPVSGPANNRTLLVVGGLVVLFFTWPFLLGGGFLLAGIALPFAMLVLTGLVVWWLVSGKGFGGEAAEVAKSAALGIGVLVLCLLMFLGGAWAAAAGSGAVAAALVIATGVVLAVGAFSGGLRALMLPALALALGVGFVSAAGIDLDGGVGERDYRPVSAADVRERYELSMGELVVDLRDSELPAGDTPLKLELGMGEANLIVPRDVCVASSARIGMGDVNVFGRDSGGIDVDWRDSRPAPVGTSRVVVDADVGVGAFRVTHERESDFGPPYGPGQGYGGDERGNEACASASAAR